MDGTKVNEASNLNGRYIVWGPASGLPPQVVYNDRPTTIKVAHALAAKNPKERFAVCKIVGEARVEKVAYEDFGG